MFRKCVRAKKARRSSERLARLMLKTELQGAALRVGIKGTLKLPVPRNINFTDSSVDPVGWKPKAKSTSLSAYVVTVKTSSSFPSSSAAEFILGGILSLSPKLE